MKRCALIALAACAAPVPPRAEPAPRLVVLLVIDQLPEWAFAAKRPALHGGFERLLGEGTWHVGRHPSAATLTAPGHALLGSGEPPARSGILANEWWHRDLNRSLKSVEDEDGSVSARWSKVAGLGDAIAAAGTGAKAVSVSLKDRSAVLPLGHHGRAIWYDAKTTSWQALGAMPAWLADWNRVHPVAARLGEVWTVLDTVPRLAGVADAAPGELGEKHFGPTFPHDPATTPAPAEAIFAMPLGNDLVLDTATAAITGEALGADRTPDLLAISLSAHDYIGHGWGQESWEAWDALLRLDARLARFAADLDRLVGAGQWAMIVTSDHGASPMPHGRQLHAEIRAAAAAAAQRVLGPGDWITSAHFPAIYLARGAERAADAVIAAVRALPGIERAGRVADVAGHCETRHGDDEALCLTFDPERSGDIYYVPAAGWILVDDDELVATSHGSLHDTDRLVPLIVVPPGRAHHAAASTPSGELPMTEVAPLLARWLGVADPRTLRSW